MDSIQNISLVVLTNMEYIAQSKKFKNCDCENLMEHGQGAAFAKHCQADQHNTACPGLALLSHSLFKTFNQIG